MKNRKMWIKILVLTALLILSGCGKKAEQETENLPVVRIGISEKTGISQDFEKVSEKLGELTEKKIGVRAELVWIGGSGSNNYYKNREQGVDITNMYFDAYQKNKKKNLLLNMKEYLKEAPALTAVLKEKVQLPMKEQQGVYGIPKPLSDLHGDGVILNREYVEKYQMDVSKIHEPEDMEPLFEIIKKEEPEVIPWALEKSGNAVLEREVVGDLLDGCLSSIKYGADEEQVYNLYESKDYEKQIMRAKRWQEKGYLAKNIRTEVETGRNQVIVGDAFAAECVIKPDENQYDESIYGDKIIIKAFDRKPVLNTRDDWVLVWSIYSETEYPREAVQVLNLLYEDREVLDLILYGIEGLHYEVLPDGSLDFPEGVTYENVGYKNNSKWKYNTPKADIWNGMSNNLAKEMEEMRQEAILSNAYGFWLEEEKISVNLNRIGEIVNEYTPKLKTGQCDTEDYLVLFQQKLREAGAAQLVKEVQKQFDDWKKMTEKEH